MKLLNHTFENCAALEQFIDNELPKEGNILVQLFSGISDITTVQSVLDVLNEKIPNAVIIGASTAGEISGGIIHSKTVQLSFSVFENSSLRTIYYPKVDFQTGVDAVKGFSKKDTKAVLAFCEALKGDSELFLEGFSSVEHNIPIAGGNAGDNLEFKETFVINKDKIYFEGIVLCAIDSETLSVSTNYSLEWTPVGKEMIITKAQNNVVYEIDNLPVEKIYRYYLGDEILLNFPATVVEFPLIKTDENVKIARSIVARTDDEGFVYAGHFKNGDKVKFAIGNVEEILNKAQVLYDNIISAPVEATYIYSCSVRKLFLKDQLNYEFGLIEQIAPAVGFFTYGEFYHGKTKNQLLNITTTTLSLSESTQLKEKQKITERKAKTSMLKSLTNLVNISEKALNNNIIKLNQYKEILDNSAIVSKTDERGIITYVNDEFCRVSGYSREELLGQKHNIVKHPETEKSVFTQMWKDITHKKVWHGTIKNLTKNGETYYVKSVIMPILDEEGNITEYIAARTDVTDLIQKDKIIKRQFEDVLTGLQNRASLLYQLSIRPSEYASLILINIDRFSDINDYFGYETGDKVLQEFALRLKQKHEKVYRISGDEFAILCEHDLNEENKADIIKLILDLERSDYKLYEDVISVFLSCGVAYGRRSEIYKFSHIALKENKKSNKHVIFYNDNDNLDKKIKDNINIIAKIKEALQHDRFLPFFQGIVDNKTKKIVKYESLIRLKESDGKIVSPFFFLEHAKKAKLYIRLTEVMIVKSFEKFANLDYEFSINLSLQDIESVKIVNLLIENLEKYRCGNRVVLEIVESEGIDSFEKMSEFISIVKQYGCKIAIDDFGTGYSNFSYLSKLHIDYIKIDGSLIKDIDKDETQLATVESILHFAKKMDIKTIAEFVENETIYNVLHKLGVDFSQGYFFSKPQEELAE
ncbi:EAL domain-containing protein [Sulfurimonas sp. HSL-1716]|uniref:sensor domain-containing phosphodiesterase n=1 Tax=Hydrocurvibacter sulfurireducens TaxID=3131937 RepID=UPI0031F8A441